MFLFIIVAACVGLRQWELYAAVQGNLGCTQMVVDLKHKTGKCGPEQLKELKTCRVELKRLSEVKGKCLVYEKNIKEDNSKALVKQADDLMVLLSISERISLPRRQRGRMSVRNTCEK